MSRDHLLLLTACALLTCTVGCNVDHPDYQESVPALSDSGKRFEREIAAVEHEPTVWVMKDGSVEPTKIRCSNCHSTREPQTLTNTSSELTEFHQGLIFNHGEMSCLSCHNRDDYDTLGLANGESVAFSDVMTLCGQCHGPQLRDYKHGAHGGGMGYWDARKGAKKRNNCVHCHDPHSPAFRAMQPTFKPRDRFLSNEHASEEDHR